MMRKNSKVKLFSGSNHRMSQTEQEVYARVCEICDGNNDGRKWKIDGIK